MRAKKETYDVPRFRITMVRDSRGKRGSGHLFTGEAVRVLHETMQNLPHEEVWILMVDTCSHLIGRVKVGQGGRHAVGLNAADILRPAIVGNAAGIILGHNHPSGDPTPSKEDIALTKGVVTACQAICVPLLDHIIVTDDVTNYTSFFQNGIL